MHLTLYVQKNKEKGTSLLLSVLRAIKPTLPNKAGFHVPSNLGEISKSPKYLMYPEWLMAWWIGGTPLPPPPSVSNYARCRLSRQHHLYMCSWICMVAHRTIAFLLSASCTDIIFRGDFSWMHANNIMWYKLDVYSQGKGTRVCSIRYKHIWCHVCKDWRELIETRVLVSGLVICSRDSFKLTMTQ